MKKYLSSDRSFGILISIVFLAISVMFFGTKLTYLVWISFFSLILSIIKPKIFNFPKVLWIKFGWLLGKIINPIICAFLYYIVIGATKIGLEIFRKKLIYKEKQNDIDTYWINRKDNTYKNFDNQF